MTYQGAGRQVRSDDVTSEAPASGNRRWTVVEWWRWLLRGGAVVALLVALLGLRWVPLDVGIIVSRGAWGRAWVLLALVCLSASYLGRRRFRPATARDSVRMPLRTLLVALATAAIPLLGIWLLLVSSVFSDALLRIGERSPGGCQAYLSYGPTLFGRGTSGGAFVRQPGDVRLQDQNRWWRTGRDGFDPRGRTSLRWDGREGVITVDTPEGHETLTVTCSR